MPEHADYETTMLTGQRTALGVPLFREGKVIGVFVLARRRVEPFTDDRSSLPQHLRIRPPSPSTMWACSTRCRATRELTEALQQQTATAEVLKVISRSAFDLNVSPR